MSDRSKRARGLPKPARAGSGQWWAFEAKGEPPFGPARVLRGPDREGGLAFDDAGRKGAYEADLLGDPRWVYLGDDERPGDSTDDQKNASANRKESSAPPVALDAERRRRTREAAQAAAREAPGEWRTGEDGWTECFQGFYGVTCDAGREDADGPVRRVMLQPNHNFPVEPISRHVVETQPSAVLALLDTLEQAERERDSLRERLAAAERRVEELEEREETRRSVAYDEMEREP